MINILSIVNEKISGMGLFHEFSKFLDVVNVGGDLSRFEIPLKHPSRAIN